MTIKNLQKISFIKTYGNSMYPLLHNEDIVYLRKVAIRSLRVDDIICFKKYGKLQTHRVVYKTNTYVITKGDNNYKADGKVYARQIVGRIYQVKRNGEIFNPEHIYLLQSTLYFQEIIKINNAFKKAGIDFVFLKGLPLHIYYENRLPTRLYSDCDLLIKKEQLNKIDKIFQTIGYTFNNSQNLSLTTIKDEQVEITYWKKIKNIYISFDIHLEVSFLTYKRGKFTYFYSQKLVDRLSELFLFEKEFRTINNIALPLLTLENQILYLLLHFFKDNFKDIHRMELLLILLRKYKNSSSNYLKSFIIKSSTYQLNNILYSSLFIIKQYFNDQNIKNIAASLNPSLTSIFFLKHILVKESSFNFDNMHRTNIKRFRNLFILSSTPLCMKIASLLRPLILLSLLRAIRRIQLKYLLMHLILFSKVNY